MGFEWFVDVSAVFSQPIAVPKDVSYFYFLKKLATFELPPEPARKRVRAAGLIATTGAGYDVNEVEGRSAETTPRRNATSTTTRSLTMAAPRSGSWSWRTTTLS